MWLLVVQVRCSQQDIESSDRICWCREVHTAPTAGSVAVLLCPARSWPRCLHYICDAVCLFLTPIWVLAGLALDCTSTELAVPHPEPDQEALGTPVPFA